MFYTSVSAATSAIHPVYDLHLRASNPDAEKNDVFVSHLLLPNLQTTLCDAIIHCKYLASTLLSDIV